MGLTSGMAWYECRVGHRVAWRRRRTHEAGQQEALRYIRPLPFALSLFGLREIRQAQRDPHRVAGAADDDLALAFFHAGGQGDDGPQARATQIVRARQIDDDAGDIRVEARLRGPLELGRRLVAEAASDFQNGGISCPLNSYAESPRR